MWVYEFPMVNQRAENLYTRRAHCKYEIYTFKFQPIKFIYYLQVMDKLLFTDSVYTAVYYSLKKAILLFSRTAIHV